MNFIQTATRSLLKNKSFALLNISGLTLGIATCLLIVLYVSDELSYDRYNANANRIFRVNTDLTFGGANTAFAITGPPVADALVSNFPEVEKAVRLAPSINTRFAKGEEVIKEDRVLFADPELFEVFTLSMVSGNPQTALTTPNTIVITESIAKKYFARTDVLGQTLLNVNDSTLYTITGIIRDMPGQSHFVADLFLSMNNHNAANDPSFNRFTFNTYVLLKEGADPGALDRKFPSFLRSHLSSTMDMDQFEKGGNSIRISLQPITNIHLYSNRQRELGANGDVVYVYIFSAIAFLVLVLACINFMNLSTARSANRVREVGIRKVLGSLRWQLIFQFLSESIVVTLVASLLAIGLAFFMLPIFNEMAGKDLSMTLESARWILPALLFITVVVGILAGFYPAFFLSSFQPVHVLKGKLASGLKGGRLRSILVVFQFSISTFLVIGTLVILNQLEFIQRRDLGFDREHVLIIKNVGVLDNPLILKQEVMQFPEVLNSTLSGYLPTGGTRWTNNISAGQHNGLLSEFWNVDTDYVPTLDLKLQSGRNFSKELASDSLAVIVNETAAAQLGYGVDPLDKLVHANDRDYHIIGVVHDFNFASLRENITPLVLALGDDWRASLNIRVGEKGLPTVLEHIKTRWKQLAPNHSFEYSFMDQDFEAIYRTEQRMEQLFLSFTVLAIIIACLGLFGLSSYVAEQRTREISIRKVLGATVTNLTRMLTKDFVRLILISILIAMPLAWLATRSWLETFAYKSSLPWWAFLISGLSTLLIGLITVSYQAIRAAKENPVDNLRGQ